MHLLDVNVLVALCDPAHEFHRNATAWFGRVRSEGWSSCPITENGLVRIFGHPGYPGGPGSPAKARPLLQALLRTPGHVFWPDEVSIGDPGVFPSLDGAPSAGLTDLYLLGLAVHRGARFATFDRRIDPAVLPGGTSALVIVPAKAPSRP
jgi:toxin-antitoxin system PIN domain toxin